MRRLIRTLVVAMMIPFFGAVLRAAPSQADAWIEQASMHYANLDFEAALKLLDRAIQRPGNTREQLVRIYHLRGLCYGSLARYEEARADFARLLTLDPTVRLGSDISPRVRKPFEALLSRAPRRLDVRLLPPPRAQRDEPLVFTAQVVADPLGMAKALSVWYRRGDTGRYSSIRTKLRGEGEHRVRITPPAWDRPGSKGPISWYATIEGRHRAQLQKFGDAVHPYALEVVDKSDEPIAAIEQTHWYERWWVWAIVGGVAVAAAAPLVYMAVTPDEPDSFDFFVDFSTAQ